MHEFFRKGSRGSRLFAALLGVLIFSSGLCPRAALAFQDPLDLDLTFSGDGKASTNFALSNFADDHGNAIAIQSDGKIVVAGRAFNSSTNSDDFALARYNADGSPDLGFGSNGIVATDFDSTTDTAYGVVIQPDGKIVVAGAAGDDDVEVSWDIALARYNSDGSLDPSFGTNGLVRNDLGGFETAYGLARQQDGKLVVAGQHKPVTNASDFLLVRYLPDGTLDTTFGTNGQVLTNFGMFEIARDLAIQDDGKIVVTGSTWGQNFFPTYNAMARYQPDGQLDTSFGVPSFPSVCVIFNDCGKVVTNFGGNSFEYGQSIALHEDDAHEGKIVVAGQFGVARFAPDGTLDYAFGTNGMTDDVVTTGDAVTIRDDGRIMVTGKVGGDFNLALYSPKGVLDNDCSANGVVHTDFGGTDSGRAIAIQEDGKVVVAGSAAGGNTSDFGVARYKGSSCLLSKLNLFFVDYHIFVPPWEEVGPPWPGAPYRIAPSTHLAVSAAMGRGAGERLAFQAYTVTSSKNERQDPAVVRISNQRGVSVVSVSEPALYMVPTTIQFGSARGSNVDESGAHAYLCHGAAVSEEAASNTANTRITLHDVLAGAKDYELGRPRYVCGLVDQRGRDVVDQTVKLVGYEVARGKSKRREDEPLKMRASNMFDSATVVVREPQMVFIPSRVE